MAKYLAELQRAKVFHLEYVTKLTGNESTARSLLQSYRKAGYVRRIRRDYYVALDLSSQVPIASRYEIGSNINNASYLSYHTALEFYGIANQVFSTTYVTSQERFTSFSTDGITFERVTPKIFSGVINLVNSPLIHVTDLERTVIDCIEDFEKAGGLEELLVSLRSIPYLDELMLLKYLTEYNKIFLWQKAGFLLELFAEGMSLNPSFFTQCRKHISKRKNYLTLDSTIYQAKWQLYTPKKLMIIMQEEVEDFV